MDGEMESHIWSVWPDIYLVPSASHGLEQAVAKVERSAQRAIPVSPISALTRAIWASLSGSMVRAETD
jgi:hypothetical protein